MDGHGLGDVSSSRTNAGLPLFLSLPQDLGGALGRELEGVRGDGADRCPVTTDPTNVATDKIPLQPSPGPAQQRQDKTGHDTTLETPPLPPSPAALPPTGGPYPEYQDDMDPLPGRPDCRELPPSPIAGPGNDLENATDADGSPYVGCQSDEDCLLSRPDY